MWCYENHSVSCLCLCLTHMHARSHARTHTHTQRVYDTLQLLSKCAVKAEEIFYREAYLQASHYCSGIVNDRGWMFELFIDA